MNKKRLIIFFCLFFIMTGGTLLNAQVSIGGSTPQPPQPFSVLELISTPTVSVGGLRLPQLNEADKASIKTALTGNDKSKGLLIYNSEKEQIEYWDGSQWVAMGSDVTLPWQISESTELSNSVSVGDKIYHLGPVTIGSDGASDPSAALNVIATNKGVLFPRVALLSTTDQTTVPSPTPGLLVYNTGKGGLTYTGYVFWNETEWVSLTSGSLAEGTIGAITCNGISITPPTYTADTEYMGTMSVPYTGSNGGVYPAMTLGPVNGLTATLASGNFTPGAGTLSFAVTGTPTVTSPETTTFSLNVGGRTCDAVIGAGDGIAPGDMVFYASNEFSATVGTGNIMTGTNPVGWMSTYVTDLPVIGGKLRLDGYFSGTTQTGSGGTPFNPRLVNITSSPVKLWFSAMSTVDNFNGNNVVIAAGSYLSLDNSLYYTAAPNQTITNPGTAISTAQNNTEVLTLDLQLDQKWYRVYYFPIIDNKDQTTVAGMTRKVYLSIQRLY